MVSSKHMMITLKLRRCLVVVGGSSARTIYAAVLLMRWLAAKYTHPCFTFVWYETINILKEMRKNQINNNK